MVHQHGEIMECEFPGCGENPISHSLRGVLSSATAANVVLGSAEVTVGWMTDSVAALADGVHSLSDVVSHAMHTSTHKAEEKLALDSAEHNAKRVKNRRNLAAAAIAVGALYTGYHAYDTITNPEEESFNSIAFGTEVGAIAVNGVLFTLIKRRNDGTKAQLDAKRHVRVDGAISTMSAASIAVSPFFAQAQGVSALVATGASVWLAYRTATGNEHEHEQTDTIVMAEK